MLDPVHSYKLSDVKAIMTRKTIEVDGARITQFTYSAVFTNKATLDVS